MKIMKTKDLKNQSKFYFSLLLLLKLNYIKDLINKIFYKVSSDHLQGCQPKLTHEEVYYQFGSFVIYLSGAHLSLKYYFKIGCTFGSSYAIKQKSSLITANNSSINYLL